MDGLFIMAATDRPVRFVVYSEYFKRPIVGRLLRAMRAIPISPSGGPRMILQAFREAGKALLDGLPRMTPGTRSIAVRALLGRADWTADLLAAVDDGRLGWDDFTLDQKQALAAHPDKALAEKAAMLIARGGALPDADRDELRAGADALGRRVDALREALKDRPKLLALLPDVAIFREAVDSALRHGEFFDLKEVAAARTLLETGADRAGALERGEAPWDAATGLVVRGYVSKIDGSIQPYGLVVPESYRDGSPHRSRLDVWCHGRGETLSEVNFLRQRMTSVGEFAPADAFVLHPYGRFCNANKFAGEVDLFEALDDVKARYPIDEDRLILRGFSMGGAAAWQFATHFPGVWAAAAPGAGFSEAADFLGIFRPGAPPPPPWYEQTLWRLYDSTGYAANLFNVPTVAYSGEKDGQKQAADFMARALADDLRRFLDGRTVSARTTGRAERAWRLARRRPAASAAACVLLLAAVALPFVGVAFASLRGRAEAGEAAARLSRRDARSGADAAARVVSEFAATIGEVEPRNAAALAVSTTNALAECRALLERRPDDAGLRRTLARLTHASGRLQGLIGDHVESLRLLEEAAAIGSRDVGR
ncbi:hypothetical protein HK102_010146, partial [Quaeritorhiza haematococci]